MNLETLIQQVLNYSPDTDPLFLQSAFDFAQHELGDQELAPGLPAIDHAVGTASVLTSLQLGPEAIAAALLHDVPLRTSVTFDRLGERFGDETAQLVESTARLSGVSWGKLEDVKAASLRKLFLAMVDDVRVALIRLAEQLNTMHALSLFPADSRRRMAEDTLYIFAPLAHRLGIGSLKWQMEDIALQYLEPQKFQEIAGYLSDHRHIRERAVQTVIDILQREMRTQGIHADISGRPKHIYSIYKKMKSTQRDFSEIYDVQAVRIIVEDLKDCYAALDLVHGLWPPIPGEFDDYIVVPKPNLYQSLHTAVRGPQDSPLEIQIRSRSMHRTAELGIAAHWRYKEKAGRDISLDAKVAALRGLLDWQRDLFPQDGERHAAPAHALTTDVFVLTPRGDIVALPPGSTPLDFAYRIHTGIGHRCRGAKVNGKMVPLDHRLQIGDRVEILTGKKESPSRDWLNPRHGFVRSPRARRDIRMWFLKQEREGFVGRGRDMVDRTLKRMGERIRDYDKLSARFSYARSEDFLEAVGRGLIRPDQLKHRLSEKPDAERRLPESIDVEPAQLSKPGAAVKGMEDLLTRVARCCNPLPGDRIVGYITRGRGITLHRHDCHNAQRLDDRDRLIEVTWGGGPHSYAVPVRISGSGSQKMLKDVAQIIEEEHAKLLGTSVRVSSADRLHTVLATLEISSVEQLQKILKRIKGLPSVTEARRIVS
jgi:GTP pyrophosphokinase